MLSSKILKRNTFFPILKSYCIYIKAYMKNWRKITLVIIKECGISVKTKKTCSPSPRRTFSYYYFVCTYEYVYVHVQKNVTFSQFSNIYIYSTYNSRKQGCILHRKKESRFLLTYIYSRIVTGRRRFMTSSRAAHTQKLIAEYVNVNRIRTWLMIFKL